jgi:hypothetical protein
VRARYLDMAAHFTGVMSNAPIMLRGFLFWGSRFQSSHRTTGGGGFPLPHEPGTKGKRHCCSGRPDEIERNHIYWTPVHKTFSKDKPSDSNQRSLSSKNKHFHSQTPRPVNLAEEPLAEGTVC